MRPVVRTLLVLTTALIAPTLAAQSAPIFYPVIMSSPATGLGLGAGVLTFSRDTVGFGGPGNARVELLMTRRGSGSAAMGMQRHLTSTRGRHWVLNADASISSLPARVGDLHGAFAPSTRLDYGQQLATGFAAMRLALTDHFAIGPTAAWRSNTRLNALAGAVLPTPLAEAAGTTTALGAWATFDRRNQVYQPSSGVLLDLRVTHNEAHVATVARFTRVSSELKGFLPIGTRSVLALQAVAAQVGSGAPADQLPMTGEFGTFRGIDPGLVRARAMAQAQAEVRTTVNSRLALVAFANTGSVADAWRTMHWNDLQAIGGGLRYHPRGNPRFSVRIDVGSSRGRTSTLVGFGEAF